MYSVFPKYGLWWAAALASRGLLCIVTSLSLLCVVLFAFMIGFFLTSLRVVLFVFVIFVCLNFFLCVIFLLDNVKWLSYVAAPLQSDNHIIDLVDNSMTELE